MGAIWIAVPFEGQTAEWVAASEVPVPADAREGRIPTLEELRTALLKLPTLSVSESNEKGEWRFELSTAGDPDGPWTVLRFKPDLAPEPWLSFSRGTEEAVLEVVTQLAATVGSMVLVADYDGAPVLVTQSSVARVPESDGT